MINVIKNAPLWSVTTWDKSFNGVEKEWQPKTIKYKYLLSDELDQINVGGDVYLLYTGKDEGYTTEELAGEAIAEGEIVSIPWGGTPSVKYYKGRFVTGDNRIATSSKPKELLNKYLYYYLKGHIREIASYYRGAGLKHPAMRDVLKMNISYPSPDDQKTVISQFEQLENIIELRRRELDKLDELIKARFVELFGHPDKNEKSWKMNTFGDICTVRQGLQIPISKRLTEYEEGCYEYITVQYLHGGKEREYIKNPKNTVVCNKDDILMTRTGNTGMVITGVDGVFHNNFFLIDFDRDKYDKNFLVQYLNLDMIQADILRRAGTSTIPDLNHGEFYKIQVFEPPRSLQVEFNVFFKQVDKSKVALQKALDETQTLFDSLMQKYFG